MKHLDGYIARLRELPFIKAAGLDAPVRFNGPWKPDVVIRLKTSRGTHRLGGEIKGAPLTKASVQEIRSRTSRKRAASHILLTPYVSAPMASRLAEQQINFVDLAGNCHLAIGSDYLAHIEGKRPLKLISQSRGMRRSGYRVLFALLVKPELAREPVRTIASVTGVSKSGAAEVLTWLEQEKAIGWTTEGRQFLFHPRWLERWLAGYMDILRPALLVGRYRSREKDPFRLEKMIEQALPQTKEWAWGGGAASFRLTGHYRGEKTILHMDHVPEDLNVRLKLLPDPQGPVVILESPGPLAYESQKPNIVHPLLVYSELLAEGGEREGEAAAEVKERYLSHMMRQ